MTWAVLMRQTKPILRPSDVTSDGFFVAGKRLPTEWEAFEYGERFARRVKGLKFIRAIPIQDEPLA